MYKDPSLIPTYDHLKKTWWRWNFVSWFEANYCSLGSCITRTHMIFDSFIASHLILYVSISYHVIWSVWKLKKKALFLWIKTRRFIIYFPKEAGGWVKKSVSRFFHLLLQDTTAPRKSISKKKLKFRLTYTNKVFLGHLKRESLFWWRDKVQKAVNLSLALI